jgi:hypothetical protein
MQAADAGDSTTLLEHIRGEQRHAHMADISALSDGAIYVMVIGGFDGHMYEFVELKDNDRISLTGGFAQGGEMFYRKRLMYPFKPSYGDASIVDLRAAIARLIAAKLPTEVEHVSGDDSVVILVAEKRMGILHYWAREKAGSYKLEREFLDIMEKAKATEKLLTPPPAETHPTTPQAPSKESPIAPQPSGSHRAPPK